MTKRLAARVAFVVLLLVLFPLGGDVPFRAPSFHGISRPYAFGLVNWSIGNSLGKGLCRITQCDDCSHLSETERLELVREYLYQGSMRGWLEFRLMELEESPSSQNTGEAELLSAQLETIISEMEAVENQVEAIIGQQVQNILTDEGLCLRHNIVSPPLLFEFEELPYLVIISPRDRIEMLDTMVLRPDLTLEEITEIEARLEELGFSALVERVGGIATYPSMIPQTSSPQFVLSTVAHEWTHHYLFFHPLGRRYNSSYDMRTINETVADTVGDEIGSRLMLVFYGENGEDEAETAAGGFDFYKEMHAIRLTVDQYLERGEIEQAERFMEEKRQFLYQNGYYIRKINQAYFAWHGSYGESPASVSPIGEQIRMLREQSASLGEFLRTAAGISSPEELEELLAAH